MRLIVTAATAAMQPSVNPKRPAASMRALIRGSSSGLRRGRSTSQSYTRSFLGRRLPPLHQREVPPRPILVRSVVQLGGIAQRTRSQIGHARSVPDVAVSDHRVAGLYARGVELGQRGTIEK